MTPQTENGKSTVVVTMQDRLKNFYEPLQCGGNHISSNLLDYQRSLKTKFKMKKY